MNRLVRIVAVDDTEDSDNLKIIVDVILNGDKIIPQEFLGYMKNDNEKFPMIFDAPTKSDATSQTVNFGDCCQNRAETNLISKDIKEGELFTFTEDGVDYIYRIKTVKSKLVGS